MILKLYLANFYQLLYKVKNTIYLGDKNEKSHLCTCAVRTYGLTTHG